jgi:hypothetical protein
MNSLPRDVQLQVIRGMDIDTRVLLGIPPCKLKVPENLKKALGKLQTPSRFAERCDYMYSIKTGLILITWDELLEEKSIGILQREYQNYDYWIANPTQTEWLDLYEYMGVYGFVEL